MHVKNRPVTAIYKVAIGILAALSLWSIFANFGDGAWQQFMVWVLLMIAVYYIGSFLALIIMGKRRDTGWNFMPTWQLATIIASWLVFAEKLFWPATCFNDDQASFIAQFVLPVLTLVDWLFFSKKGQFRLIDPWYALALPICYIAYRTMGIGNFNNINVTTYLLGIIYVMTIILVGGYAIFAIDFAMSGKLSQCIVMPKIKVVEVRDDEVTSTVKKPEKGDKPKKPEENDKTIAADKSHTSDAKTKSQAKPKVKSEVKVKEIKQPAETVLKAPEEPTEPVKPVVPQIENRKKDLKSAQNLHGVNKNK